MIHRQEVRHLAQFDLVVSRALDCIPHQFGLNLDTAIGGADQNRSRNIFDKGLGYTGFSQVIMGVQPGYPPVPIGGGTMSDGINRREAGIVGGVGMV